MIVNFLLCFILDINNIISAKMEHYLENLRLKYERDINNLYRVDRNLLLFCLKFFFFF